MRAPWSCFSRLRWLSCGSAGGEGRVSFRSCKWSLESGSWQPCSRRTCLRPGGCTTKPPGSLAHTLFSVGTRSRAHSMAPRQRTVARHRYSKLHKSQHRTQPARQALEPWPREGGPRGWNNIVATIGVSSIGLYWLCLILAQATRHKNPARRQFRIDDTCVR